MSTTQPLVTPADLADWGTFTSSLVEASAAMVRREAGWHIAPSVTETVWVESFGTHWLFLPTLYLTEVASVKDEDGNALDGWNDKPTARFTAGCLRRGKCWPCGPLQVSMTHGYDECPADLLPAIAARTQRRVQQESLGSRSVTFFSGGDSPLDDAVARYKIPVRP